MQKHVWSVVDFRCVLLLSSEVYQVSAGGNEFLSGSGDFVGQTSGKVPSQHPKPQSELHTWQEFEWMRECLSQPVHFALNVTLWYVCASFALCVSLWVHQRLIKPLFLDWPLRFFTVDITRTAEIYYLYSKHQFSVSPADMRNKTLTIYLIRGVSFHSRIVSLKRSGGSEQRAAANR